MVQMFGHNSFNKQTNTHKIVAKHKRTTQLNVLFDQFQALKVLRLQNRLEKQ